MIGCFMVLMGISREHIGLSDGCPLFRPWMAGALFAMALAVMHPFGVIYPIASEPHN